MHFARVAIILIYLFALRSESPGQEAIRQSLAGAEAAAERNKAASTLGYYNVKIGPTGWRFSAGLGLGFNDNVSLRQVGQESDVIISPHIDAKMVWPITDKNSLNFAIGGGYSAYLQHSGLSRAFITPGSALSFDLYAGDFWINLHDNFSISQQAYQDPTVTGTGNYSELQNAIGIGVTWDLNKAVVRLGYDHNNYIFLNSTATNSSGGLRPDGESEVVSLSTGFLFKPELRAGLELGGSKLHYTQTSTNSAFSDALQWNAGAFLESRLTDYLSCGAHAGYTRFIPQNSQVSLKNFDGFYAQLMLEHRVNRFLDYTLSGGRAISFALYGGTVDLYSARWQANWRVFRKTGLSSSFTFEHGIQNGLGGETFDRYGPGLSLNRALTQKLTGSFTYQFYWRKSSQAGRDYTANDAMLGLDYAF